MRREQEYVGRKMMKMELLGKRKRRKPKRRFLDVVKEDMGKLVQRRRTLKIGRFREDDTLWLHLIEGKGRKKKKKKMFILLYFKMVKLKT